MSIRPKTSVPPSSSELGSSGNPILAELSALDRDCFAPFLEELWVDPGTLIVREGERDRAMYFVLHGTARISRGGLDLGETGQGGHFGELALIADRPRAATITAASRLQLAMLTYDHYRDFTAKFPELALRVVHALVGGVAARLLEVTDSVGLLLHERSLPRRLSVEVKLHGETRRAPTGTPLGKLLPETIDGRLVVAALVDRKASSLTSPLSSDCSLEPLTVDHWEGQSIYRRSQALVLLEAARRISPDLDLRMGHSVGFAQRVTASGAKTTNLPELAQQLEDHMRELVAEDAPLREEWWTVDEAKAHFAAVGWTDLANLLDTWREPAVPLVSWGKAYAVRLGAMLPSTGKLSSDFRVLNDDGGLLMVYGTPAGPGELAPPGASAGSRLRFSASLVEQARAVSQQASTMTRDQDRWLETLGITSIGAFNGACIRGDVSQLIRVSEGFQEKRIGRVADDILARGRDVKVVCIAGPSSSGKTTFIKRLKVQLQVNGINPVGVSLDDYYVDREDTPKDEKGDYDYEAFEALRVDLLGEHTARLLNGDTVRTAHYEFATGVSQPEGGAPITLGERDILMLEGIHGLNPQLLSRLPASSVYRVFACPLVQLPFDRLTRVHASDVRLLRRIVRDRHSRGATAAMNIMRWPSVRAGERKHIFPFQHHADSVFDSSLVYELSVLKVFAERYLLEVPQSDQAYTTAFRLLGLLDRFVTIYPDHVPPTSILREFIGGSGFEY
ncbi:MAG: cyclic nucleotide-binding domain-containing protein [Myxococcales bacterium]|nr:cyclic nucleotide-binding domain-containing protein [Myxococcales bacterium]